MCGIVRFDGAPVDDTTLGRMVDALRHRGPNDEGVWTEGEDGFRDAEVLVVDDGTQSLGTEHHEVVCTALNACALYVVSIIIVPYPDTACYALAIVPFLIAVFVAGVRAIVSHRPIATAAVVGRSSRIAHGLERRAARGLPPDDGMDSRRSSLGRDPRR